MIAPHVFEPSSDDGETSPFDDGLSAQNQTPAPWSRRVRATVSLVLVLHLAAIVSAPWAMQPSSVLAQRVFSFFQPYVDLAFLNHGYHFFAPEPGPSHLIRYELQLEDGKLVTGQFPDPHQHSPRLLYHRHFMLSETANRLAVDPTQQTSLDALSRSFANHLMSRYPAERATLYLRRHYIPTPDQVAAGLPLDAPELFAERPLGTFDRDAASSSSGTAQTVRSSLDSGTAQVVRSSPDSGAAQVVRSSPDSGAAQAARSVPQTTNATPEGLRPAATKRSDSEPDRASAARTQLAAAATEGAVR